MKIFFPVSPTDSRELPVCSQVSTIEEKNQFIATQVASLMFFSPRHQPYFQTTGNLTYLFSGRTFLSWFSLRDRESEFSSALQGVGRKTLPNNHKSCLLFRAQVFYYTAAGLDDLSLSYCYRSFLERHILLFRKHFLLKLHTL